MFDYAVKGELFNIVTSSVVDKEEIAKNDGSDVNTFVP